MRSTLDLEDTIVALSSAPGGAPHAIVRMSGPDSFSIFQSLASTGAPVGGRWRASVQVRLTGVHSPFPADVLGFTAPATYTGQDLIEWHVLGSPPLVDALIAEIVRHRARMARPGEFTLRAFLAGKLDLAQAEGVLATIHACHPTELQQALAQMAGLVSHPLHAVRDRLLHLLAEVEAALDFAEEDLSFLSSGELLGGLGEADDMVAELLQKLASRSLSGRPFRAVLAGPPNAGKSSLFNAIAGKPMALVSPEAGTTRDYLVHREVLDGMEVEFIDTAGADTAVTGDIEGQAQAARQRQVEEAELVLYCQDASATEPIVEGQLGVTVWTKCDLANQISTGSLRTSAVDGMGVGELRQLVADRARQAHRPGILAGSLSRCHEHLDRIRAHLHEAQTAVQTQAPAEFVALELRLALEQIGEVVGEVYTDDLLDRIFSQFCIGK